MAIQGNKNDSHMRFADVAKAYEPLIDSAVKKYLSCSSEDPEDLRQEAMIALYGAYITYDSTQTGVTFGLYAKVCIRNRLVSVLRKSRAHEDFYTPEAAFIESPEDAIIAHEDYERMLCIVDKLLTPYEKSVFELYLKNMPYKEIAKRLSTSAKSVDNAICRIKAKIKQNL